MSICTNVSINQPSYLWSELIGWFWYLFLTVCMDFDVSSFNEVLAKVQKSPDLCKAHFCVVLVKFVIVDSGGCIRNTAGFKFIYSKPSPVGLIRHRQRNFYSMFVLSLITIIRIFVNVAINTFKPDNAQNCECPMKRTFTILVALMDNIYLCLCHHRICKTWRLYLQYEKEHSPARVRSNHELCRSMQLVAIKFSWVGFAASQNTTMWNLEAL